MFICIVLIELLHTVTEFFSVTLNVQGNNYILIVNLTSLKLFDFPDTLKQKNQFTISLKTVRVDIVIIIN